MYTAKTYLRIKALLTALTASWLLIAMQGCGVYSFTGASISPEVKTISIKRFPNNAQLVEPSLSEKFTNALKDKFAAETNLILVESGGDLRLEGQITQYSVKPVAIQGNQTAALNRLTIAVKVDYNNTFDDSRSFETSFSQFEEYPSSQNLANVQETLIDEINEKLVQDIFNKAVVNW